MAKVEISLKIPVKVFLASPIYQLEVLKIETDLSTKPTSEINELKNDNNFLYIKPLRVFATQHTDWIDLESSAVVLPYMYIPKSNVSMMLVRA